MRNAASSCEICGRALDSGEAVAGRRGGLSVCGDAECRAASRAAPIAEAEARDDARILAEARRAAPPYGRVVALAIPSGLTTVAPLPPARRERYRRHLERTIAEAFQATRGAVSRDRQDALRTSAAASERFLEERPGLAERTAQACGLCKGGCCVAGGEHAFVSTVTIRRLMDADPTLDADDILETYLSHLPDRSIEGACVNQTASGCALPRAWRSDACNAWFCRGLEAFHEAWDEAEPPDAVLLIRRANTDENRFATGEANPIVEVAWADEGSGSMPRRLNPRSAPAPGASGPT